MARQLKTYVMTSGFFELAVAAPSMKAAAEIWGAGPDLFHRGYASLSSDPAITKATLAKPGVVLKRAVGSSGGFSESPALPPASAFKAASKQKSAAEPSPRKTPRAQKQTLNAAAREDASRLYALAQKRRQRELERAEAERRKAEARRQKAERALSEARDRHERRAAELAAARAELEGRARQEEDRWREDKRRLEAAVRDAM